MEAKTYAERLINGYTEKHPTKVDELKALDKKVKNPARIFAYIFGVIGSLVLGTGMCLAMKIIAQTTQLMLAGIGIGLVGILMVSVNYYIYQKILNKRKKKYAEQIIEKSNEILNQD